MPDLVTKSGKSPYWQMDFDVDGERVCRTTKLKNKAKATALAREVRSEIIQRKADDKKFGPDIPLLTAAARYIAERGASLVNIAMVERSLDWLVLRIGEQTMLRDIDDRVVAEAVSARSAMYRYGRVEHGKVSNATVNLEVVHMLRRILVRARRVWKIQLPDEPRWGMHLLKETPRRRQAFIQEQISIEEARPDLVPIVRFILIAGVRRAEAIIRWSQVNSEEGVITVGTKDDGIHEIPITREIGRILDDARGNHDDFVFTYVAQHTTRPSGKPLLVRGRRYPLTGPALHRQLSTLYKKLGIEGLTVHDLRRTSGGRMQRVSGNVSMVQDHLGHAEVSTTKRVYAHIPTEDRRRAMEKTTRHYDRARAKLEAKQAA